MKRLAAVLVAAVAAASLATAASVAAKPRPALRLTPLPSIRFPDRAVVLGSRIGAPISRAGIRVRENGREVSKLSIVPAGETLSRTFGVVLVIDASNSMRGQAITSAMRAARAFQAHSPDAQALGVITFNRVARVVVRPTIDRQAVASSLQGLPRLAEKTHLWDAVGRAVDLLRQKKIAAGSVVVLTDGRDIGSRMSSAQVTSAARAAGIRVFAVGLRSPQYAPAALRAIARDTNGGYTEATSASSLNTIYSQLSAQLAREYLLRYHSELGPGRPVNVAVTVGGIPGVVTWRYVTPVPDTVPPFHRSSLDRFVTSPWSAALLALLAAAIAWFTVRAILKPGRSTVQARIGEFLSTRRTTSGTDDATSKERRRVFSQLLLAFEHALERASWWDRFKLELEIGEFPMRPVPLVVLTAASSIALAFMGALSPVLLLLAVVPPLVVRSAYKKRLRKRRKAFEDQLPDNLTVLAASLRAGHSFSNGLSNVLDEAEEPSRSELRRAIADEQLGVPVEEALLRVAVRMDSVDLEQVALVASLQKQAGGNTAEVLDVVVDGIRERFKIRRLVLALTAQGRLARWVLVGLPIAVTAWLGLANPHYLAPLFRTTAGQAMLAVAALMVTAGFFVIDRITSIEL